MLHIFHSCQEITWLLGYFFDPYCPVFHFLAKQQIWDGQSNLCTVQKTYCAVGVAWSELHLPADPSALNAKVLTSPPIWVIFLLGVCPYIGLFRGHHPTSLRGDRCESRQGGDLPGGLFHSDQLHLHDHLGESLAGCLYSWLTCTQVLSPPLHCLRNPWWCSFPRCNSWFQSSSAQPFLFHGMPLAPQRKYAELLISHRACLACPATGLAEMDWVAWQWINLIFFSPSRSVVILPPGLVASPELRIPGGIPMPTVPSFLSAFVALLTSLLAPSASASHTGPWLAAPGSQGTPR